MSTTPLRDGADLPLNERELLQLRRLFSDPFSYPPELWTWIKTRIEEDPPALSSDAILGFGAASNRAVPVVPVLDLAVDISAANTDLPSPGVSWNNLWQVNPGGGSLRSIESGPALEGTRVTLKHGFIGSTTLKHNDVSGTGRPLFLSGGDVVLTDSESIDLVLLDAMWQDTGRVETAAAVGLQSVIVQRDTPASLTGTFGVIIGETEVQDDWGGYTPGTSHILAATAGRYLATLNLMLSAGTGTTAASGGILQQMDSSLAFVRSIGQQVTSILNYGVSVTGVVELAAGEAVLFLGMTSATGLGEKWAGGFSLVKLA